jgi:hypothetical protein
MQEIERNLVGQHAPGEVRDRLEFVVDEQLWRHHDEACETKQGVSG